MSEERFPTYEEMKSRCEGIYSGCMGNLQNPGDELGPDLHDQKKSAFVTLFESAEVPWSVYATVARELPEVVRAELPARSLDQPIHVWRPAATNIYSVAIRDIPTGVRESLFRMARRFFEILPANHPVYLVPPTDYHISLLVPQDCAAPETPPTDVIRSASEAFDPSTIPVLRYEMSRVLSSVGVFELAPAGLCLGTDGTLFLGFEPTESVWKLRHEIDQGTRRATKRPPTSRPKIPVSITLARLLKPLPLDDAGRDRLRALHEDPEPVGTLSVDRVSFIHERRWMMSDVDTAGETIIPLAPRST